jgi:hypothetical protein
LKPKPLAFDDSSSTDLLLAENTAIATTAMIEAETGKIDLEENISETTDQETIEVAAIGQEEIDPTRIDHPFVATTVETVRPTAEIATVPKAIVPPTEGTTAETGRLTVATATDLKATDLLTEAVAEATVLHSEAAAETDHRIEAEAEIVQAAAEASDPVAAVADPVVVAADLDPAVVVEDLHSEVPVVEIDHLAETSTEIKIKPVKKARTTKPKQI